MCLDSNCCSVRSGYGECECEGVLSGSVTLFVLQQLTAKSRTTTPTTAKTTITAIIIFNPRIHTTERTIKHDNTSVTHSITYIAYYLVSIVSDEHICSLHYVGPCALEK